MPNNTSTRSGSQAKSKLNGPFDIPIIHITYQSYCSWHELLLKFPKSQRYTLGQTCQTQLLGLLETLLAAAAASDQDTKLTQLRLASVKIDLLRLLIRLAKDCKCLSNQAYLELESQLHETGRMLGGWIKSLQ